MSFYVYSDESGFPDHFLQTIGCIWGNEQQCSQFRESIIALVEKYGALDLKRSKIRAKKKLLDCALEVLTTLHQRRSSGDNCGLTVYGGSDVGVLYERFFAAMTKKGYAGFAFFPDKNLTLQRHTSHHIFAGDERFVSIKPVLLRNEPLLIVADLLAGMYREVSERSDLFKKNPNIITYLPDLYKVRLWQKRKELQNKRNETISFFNMQ